MKLAFIIDPIQHLNPYHDTSVALMEAAYILGHEVWITQAHQLSVVQGKAWGLLDLVEIIPIKQSTQGCIAVHNWYKLSSNHNFCALEDMDAVFMRIDPPVTISYLYATYILDYIDQNQTLVKLLKRMAVLATMLS